MKLKVLDENNQPVNGVVILIDCRTSTCVPQYTDDDGIANYDVIDGIHELELHASEKFHMKIKMYLTQDEVIEIVVLN